ncbi:hypothetical protein BDP67DRAFT_520917 [Colletotrichum lupini]|nr:hypothetical protein BDP67DRAFT_520917 [Colletotrichum lupini]
MSRQRDNARSSPRETKKSAFRRGIRSSSEEGQAQLRRPRPHTCTYCQKTFIRAEHLIRHVASRKSTGHLVHRIFQLIKLGQMRTESLSNVCPAALVLAGQMFYVDIKRSAQGSLLKVYRHHNMKRATLRPVQNMILESH